MFIVSFRAHRQGEDVRWRSGESRILWFGKENKKRCVDKLNIGVRFPKCVEHASIVCCAQWRFVFIHASCTSLCGKRNVLNVVLRLETADLSIVCQIDILSNLTYPIYNPDLLYT